MVVVQKLPAGQHPRLVSKIVKLLYWLCNSVYQTRIYSKLALLVRKSRTLTYLQHSSTEDYTGVVMARWGLVGFMVLSALVLGTQAKAEEWKMEQGGIEPGKVILGMRAGFAPLTQSLTAHSSTDVGSLVNFQAMYSLNKWLLVGMMLEWARHAVDQKRPFLDLGHQDTVSVLPTVEVRPVKFGPVIPYANMSFGVNVNSFGESSAIPEIPFHPATPSPGDSAGAPTTCSPKCSR